MRQGSINLGRIFGIPVSMDLGVLVIGGLLSWSLASVILPNGAPGLVGVVYWSVAIIGALLFFGSLLAHEMAHAILARRNGIEVVGITLWLFGGFAQFRDEPKDAGSELRISSAGPVTSLGVAVGFVALAAGLHAIGVPVVYTTLLAWLAIINGVLGVFNLLPGAPLDGGRILAAVLWKVRGDRIAGRIGAARVGKGVGIVLGLIGLAELRFLGGFGGMWTLLIGWFIFSAARNEQAFFVGERALGDVRVADVMLREPAHVRTWTTVAELVDGPLRSSRQSAVPVLDWNGAVAGVVSMADVAKVPAEQWASTEVVDVAAPAETMETVTPDVRLVDVIERLTPESGGYALVVDQGRPVGLVGPEEIRRAIELGRLRGGSSRRPRPPVSRPEQSAEPPVRPQ